MTLARRHACRLDVQIKRPMAKRVEEAPVLPALQTGGEEVRIAFIQARLGSGEIPVIPLFSGRRDAGQGRRSEEGGPIENAFLPETTFGTLADTFKKNEGRGEHVIGGLCLDFTE